MTDVTIVEFDVRETVVVEVLGPGWLCWTGAEGDEQMAVVGNGVEIPLKSDRERMSILDVVVVPFGQSGLDLCGHDLRGPDVEVVLAEAAGKRCDYALANTCVDIADLGGGRALLVPADRAQFRGVLQVADCGAGAVQ